MGVLRLPFVDDGCTIVTENKFTNMCDTLKASRHTVHATRAAPTAPSSGVVSPQLTPTSTNHDSSASSPALMGRSSIEQSPRYRPDPPPPAEAARGRLAASPHEARARSVGTQLASPGGVVNDV